MTRNPSERMPKKDTMQKTRSESWTDKKYDVKRFGKHVIKDGQE